MQKKEQGGRVVDLTILTRLNVMHREGPYAKGAFLIKDWLPNEEASLIFDKLMEELPFEAMTNFGSEVPRLVCVQGSVQEDGTVPVYRHPTDKAPKLCRWTPATKMLVDRLNAMLGSSLNHALIQLYRTGNDNISEHTDKTLDIVPGSLIVNVSFGAKRSMTLRSKKASHTEDGLRSRQDIELPHNSVFCLDLASNAVFTHAIRPNKKLLQQQDPEELAYGGARISLTLRQIGTFVTPGGLIYGSGARNKQRELSNTIPKDELLESEMRQMIIAFGKENKGDRLDWSSYYGDGYDCIR